MKPLRAASFRTQITWATVALVGVSMVVLTLLVQLVLATIVRADVSTTLSDRSAVVIKAVKVTSDGRFDVPDSVLDTGIAVYDDAGTLVAGALPKRLAEQGEDLASDKVATSVDGKGNARLLAQPFTKNGHSGVVVLSTDVGPYEAAETYALIASMVLGLIVTAAAAWVSRWITRRALRPVADMARTAADWSEHHTSQRFALGPPDNELTQLGATLDRLLDRVTIALNGEQRLTAELAHELRTPLTGVLGSAELALMRPNLAPEVRADLEEIATSARRMSATISGLLDIARGSSDSHATCTVDSVTSTLTLDAISVEGEGTLTIGAPREVVCRALEPLLDNARRHAAREVRLVVSENAGRINLAVIDDGPGLSPADLESVFAPGRSGSGGTGLGLGIARRAARSAGGDLAARPGPGGRFVVSLPKA